MVSRCNGMLLPLAQQSGLLLIGKLFTSAKLRTTKRRFINSAEKSFQTSLWNMRFSRGGAVGKAETYSWHAEEFQESHPVKQINAKEGDQFIFPCANVIMMLAVYELENLLVCATKSF